MVHEEQRWFIMEMLFLYVNDKECNWCVENSPPPPVILLQRNITGKATTYLQG